MIPKDKNIWESALYILRVSDYNFQNILFFVLSEDLFTLTNSADFSKMPHNVIFYLGLYCLLKCAFRGVLYTKGYSTSKHVLENICSICFSLQLHMFANIFTE